jgi:hypothetical protein
MSRKERNGISIYFLWHNDYCNYNQKKNGGHVNDTYNHVDYLALIFIHLRFLIDITLNNLKRYINYQENI